MTLSSGSRLGPYEIVAPLGAGGMGEVYRARDTRLDREVAVKVLPARFAGDATALRRFEREARAVAALSHPNILAIYDVGTDTPASSLATDPAASSLATGPPASPVAKRGRRGVSYVVMELLDGETLRDRLREGTLPWRKAVEIGVAVADGLAAAHSKGIIHRDLKPENIFLTKDGVVKILDFGLARVEAGGAQPESQADTPTVTLDTRPGTIIGTLNYMSPEQLRGRPTDARSDIFSFGCVLYEMVAGHRAFEGETSADTMTAILRETPSSIRSTRADVGIELERVIDRCLEKKPEQRFHSTPDLAFTLRTILADSGAAHATKAEPRVVRLTPAVALLAIIIACGSIYLGLREWVRLGPSPRSKIASVAILPFENVGGNPDTEYLADEIPAGIINRLSQLSALRVVPRSTVFRLKGRNLDHRELGRKLKVEAVVTGEVAERGNSITIHAELIDVQSDTQLWGERFTKTTSNMQTVEEEIARRISDALRLRITGEEQARLTKRYTDDGEAYRAYLQGRFWWNKRSEEAFKKAIGHFENAVRRDPKYALALAGLADTHILMGVYEYVAPSVAAREARRAVEAALRIDDALAEAHVSVGGLRLFYDWDFAAAEQSFVRAIELNPKYATAHHWYAYALLHLGHLERAVSRIEVAERLDPLSQVISADVGFFYRISGRYVEAEQVYRRTLDLGRGFAKVWHDLGMLYIETGRVEQAVAAMEEGYRLASGRGRYAGIVGGVYGLAGRTREAREHLRALEEESRERYVSPMTLAFIHAGLGDRSKAIEQLERAYADRDPAFFLLLFNPLLEQLQDDPRVADLIRRAGLVPVRDPPRLGRPTRQAMRLAVLPFEDISPAPQPWFSEGMAERVSDDLGQISELRVISYRSVKKYADAKLSTREIAAKTDADYVVTGSVLRDKDRVRITARLIEGKSDEQIWSHHYERRMSDVIALQGEVAGAIAEEIRVKLTPQEERKLRDRKQVVPEAYDAYVRGLESLRRATRESCRTALIYFDRALAIDPKFALAHVGRAKTYWMMGSTYMHPGEALPAMEQAARNALEIDENLPEAHAVLGHYRMQHDWDWNGAKESYERALELNRSSSEARLAYAGWLTAMDRGDEAMAQLDLVHELHPTSRYTEEMFGAVSFMARRFDRTIRDSLEALKIDAEFWPAHEWLGLAQSQLGQHRDAISHLRIACEISKSLQMRAMLGGVLAVAGEHEEAREIREQLRERTDVEYVCPYEVATISIGLNDYDEAFREMHRACDDKAECIPWMHADPRLDPVRDDPRFDELLMRVGFEPRHALTVTPEAKKIMLAVLPFEDSSPEPQEWFSDGMTGELIATLGKIEALGVISRTSVMRYKKTVKPLPQIARELKVGKLVEGNVLRIGKQLRITVTLIDAATDTQLWSNSYQRDYRDVIGLQNEVARAIAKEINVVVTPEEQVRLRSARAVNRDAYNSYLVGRHYLYRFLEIEPDINEAITYFRRAVETDPDYAPAYSGLADAYAWLGAANILSPEDTWPKMRQAAEKALSLDAGMSEAHVSLALAKKYHDWDWPGAEREFRRALDINPSNAQAHAEYALFLMCLKRHEEAVAEVHRALELAPRHPYWRLMLAVVLRAAGRYDEAVRKIESIIDTDPEYDLAPYILTYIYANKGKFEEAVGAMKTAMRLMRKDDLGDEVSKLGYLYGRLGRTAEARACLVQLDELAAKGRYISPVSRSQIYIGLGDKDRAFALLEEGYKRRAAWIAMIDVEPWYDPLRDDPRFDDLLRRIGLEPPPIPVEHTP